MTAQISKDTFLKTLDRLIRRQFIADELANASDVKPLRQRVRRRERSDSSPLSQQMENDWHVIDSLRMKVVEVAFSSVQNQLQIQGLHLIVMGSNIHGGAKIRGTFSAYGGQASEKSDFDYAVGANTPMSIGQIMQIRHILATELPKVARLYGFPDATTFLPCDTYSYEQYPYVDNAVDAERILRNAWKNFETIILYFYPTIPKNFGEMNRKFFLTALSSIHSSDSKRWDEIVGNLIKTIRSHKNIKPKHFGNIISGNQRDEILLQDVLAHSSVLSEKIIQDILST